MLKTLIFVVYIAVGIVVAATNDYLSGVGNVGEILNLILAIVLWPAVLLGVDFNIEIGGDGDKGGKGKDDKKGGGGKKGGALVMIGPAAAYARALVAARSKRTASHHQS
ncbi:MAG: hypothetical protein M3198_20465 [Actinomycetota bacterium]|nr:hypothetical protein [Actinomycetota bacterium]